MNHWLLKSIQQFFLFNLIIFSCAAQEEVEVIPSWPQSDKENSIEQSFYTVSGYRHTANINLVAYKLIGNDSIKCYESVFENVFIQKGVHTVSLDLNNNTRSYTNTLEIVSKFDIIPPGEYIISISYTVVDSNLSFHKAFARSVDSVLEMGTKLRRSINKTFVSKKDMREQNLAGFTNTLKKTPISADEFERNNRKVQNSLKKRKGLNTQPEKLKGKAYSALYYKNTFLGRYELLSKPNLKKRILEEERQFNGFKSSVPNMSFDNFSTVADHVKKNSKKKDTENSRGFIDILSSHSNDQEPGSGQQNNFQEFTAELNTEVLNVPITISGYYTTQDQGRQAKASFFRLHYDVDKAKSDVQAQIKSYKTQYSESKAKASSIEESIDVFMQQASAQQAQLKNELANENSLNVDELSDKNIEGLLKRYSVSNANNSDVEKARKKIERIIEINRKIKKYQNLKRQYKDGLKIDSSIIANKIDPISKQGDPSYKDLARAAVDILPESKTKNRIAGLSKLDIGILNEYESDYTMAGQTLKGGKLGYDFGVVNATVGYGKTEYISRDGNVDQYNASMLRLDLPQFKEQKIGLIYYAVTPTKKVFESELFNKDISTPVFKSPIHIVSLCHSGIVNDRFTINSEAAFSYKKAENKKNISSDNSAINTSMEYLVPRTTLTIASEWEYIGKQFENHSLPFTRAGTERYTLAGNIELLRSFLSLGVQYNFLKQSSFSSQGFNKKWGFDIKTKSKRYPNIYLSYKPFTTFRRFSDTLAVQQRPMVGEVWLAKASYRIKRKDNSHRFFFVLNMNSNSLDSESYKTNIVQLGYILTSAKNMFNFNFARNEYPSNDSSIQSDYIFNISANRNISDAISVGLGHDITFASFGVKRKGINLNGIYRFEKIPITTRMQLRYGDYRLRSSDPIKQIWSINLGLNISIQNLQNNRIK